VILDETKCCDDLMAAAAAAAAAAVLILFCRVLTKWFLSFTVLALESSLNHNVYFLRMPICSFLLVLSFGKCQEVVL
jgi:hypothetical protein